MTRLSESKLALIGAVGVILVAGVVLAALQYDKLPFFTAAKTTYTAYFAESSGLNAGAPVQVSGFQVGAVTSVDLDGARVLVTFNADEDVALGDRTEAAIKAKSLLGAKLLELTPRGTGRLSGPISIERTTPAYQLPDALGDLATTVKGLDTDQLNASLSTLAETFKDTPPELRTAVDGVARFSRTLNERDEQLRGLLANANKVTTVLSERTDQVASLIADANALLAQLQSQDAALDQISGSISALAQQISGFVAENRAQLRPALDKLNGVLTILDNRKERLQKSLKLLSQYALSLGESVGSGPFFKAYVPNLLPGQFSQPFIEAAFSDLGLDPNVLLPSQRNDPQTGTAGTPALPVPYPRTGQGGEPKLTLPDAITGNPGDQPCPGILGPTSPGPGCYPYQQPLPAPPPGGPPPGPPAAGPPELAPPTPPTPTPIYVTAPNEAAPPPATQGGR